MNCCGIYKITNTDNGKYYVGSSRVISQRWYQHKNLLKGNKHHNSRLQSDWNDYGDLKFKFEVIQVLNNDEYLEDFEQWYLDKAEKEQDISYNKSFKAYKIEMTESTRKKIGEKARERLKDKNNHPLFNKHHSDEAKLKIGIGNKGKVVSIEAREKMSKSRTGSIGLSRFGETNPMYGKKHSDITREKMKNAVKGKSIGILNGNSDKTNYTFFNTVTLQTFNGNRYDFYNAFGLTKSCVCMLIYRKLKKHKGWILK